MKVKKGGKENTEERRFRSSEAGTSLSTVIPPALLCHSEPHCFILIRLIPPRGKLLITLPNASTREQPPFRGRDEGFRSA